MTERETGLSWSLRWHYVGLRRVATDDAGRSLEELVPIALCDNSTMLYTELQLRTIGFPDDRMNHEHPMCKRCQRYATPRSSLVPASNRRFDHVHHPQPFFPRRR